MNDLKPLTKEQLHEIAVRRRGDADVKALLLEIKRLRELAVKAHQCGVRLVGYTEDANAAEAMDRFAELFDDEPAIIESERRPMPPPGPDGTERTCPPGREAKLRARIQRV